MLVANFKTIGIHASATAVAGSGDDSCILALGKNQSLSTDALTFNGAPNVALTYCTIRSNTSLKCNGHDTGAKASLAAGTASDCANPSSNQTVVPDIHAALASNISKKCSTKPGVSWTSTSIATGASVILVTQPTYLEYHVCGSLTLSGSWALGTSAQDTVVVIENGSLIMGNDASIQTNRVTFVLTGDNSSASSIQFPNGKGHAATLSLSPSKGTSNPWAGVSIYQDPSLTSTDDDWGPGATINVDGLVYLPNADVKIHGNPSSNVPSCSKIVVNTITSDGSVNLGQTTSGCSTLGVQQWAGTTLRLTQ